LVKATVENGETAKDDTGPSKEKERHKATISTDGIAHIYKIRTCTTCFIERPPLASHCSDCDQCVKNFDHHCNYVNNCIGRRNMRNFVMFINLTFISTTIFVATFFTVIMNALGKSHNVSEEDIFMLKLNMFGAFIVGVSVAAFQPMVIFALPYALKVLQSYNKTFYGKNFTFQSYQFLMMLVVSIVLCLSVPVCFMYLGLNFQGFTRKEKKAVEDTQKKKVGAVNVLKGFSNMAKFYFECEYVPSEFDKVIGADSEDEEVKCTLKHHEYEHVESNETNDTV